MSTRTTSVLKQSVPLALGALAILGLAFSGDAVGGINAQGINAQGINAQGINAQGINAQGINAQGINAQGINAQGINAQGINAQGMGIDRARGQIALVQFRGLSGAAAPNPGTNLQGLQRGTTAISYTEISDPTGGDPAGGVRLQFGPTSSTQDVRAGSYIRVPGFPETVTALKGSFWNLILTDTCKADTDCPQSSTCTQGACIKACTSDSQCTTAGGKCFQGSCRGVEGAIPLYISDVEVDNQTNSSRYPSNDDVYLYTVYYRQPATGQWAGLCPVDPHSGKATAMAIPLNPNDWSTPESRSKFTFACTASGVASKCARNWGYKPWTSRGETVWENGAFSSMDIPLAPLYDACLIAARADYCQDGASYTKNGTLVDLFDTLDGFTSINQTAGIPYAPYSTGVMLHEEYQISALNFDTLPPAAGPAKAHYVSENPNIPASQLPLAQTLRRSGMQSSRYSDRDPGRSCAASPYVDRCDAKEPYACYRSTNLAKQPYGAFLAVNSPRHCSHDEATDGEALDPLCNECVNRVCQVDPSCCGDPGASFYPGSLVWDQRCEDKRKLVCRSTEPASSIPSDPANLVGLWPAGQAAEAAGTQPVVVLRGAIGAFEGFACHGGTGPTCSGGTWYAEGWSCDPDHPGASNPVQISIGGVLGVGALHTVTADKLLVASWAQAVSAECGGGNRHGFEYPVAAGDEVYVYGIDLDTPGAPFTLLRGTKRTSPTSPLAAGTNPKAIIWSGWVTPSVSDTYTFCKRQSATAPTTCAAVPSATSTPASTDDLYRIWINGVYVGGNWRDDSTVAGATFTLASPTDRAPQYLQQGVRYGVRIEYQRPSTSSATSDFGLLWSRSGDPTVTTVPVTNLYPVAQTEGNGLLGKYYKGEYSTTPGAPVATRIEMRDFLWTGKNPPGTEPNHAPVDPDLTVDKSFFAVFEGDVVPAISGAYTFTAETDGLVSIYLNGSNEPVTETGPAMALGDTCSHDICRPGAPISRTCSEGSFCAGQICLTSQYCCGVTWDADCVQKVADICHLRCDNTTPLAVPLLAGTKTHIKVVYRHVVETGQTVHGGHLQLDWSVDGIVRDPIPESRLIAPGSSSGAGVGLNAAYFTADAAEALDRVDDTPAFVPAPSPDQYPSSIRSSIICTGGTCGSVAPGAPALVAAKSTAVTPSGVTVAVSGTGALDNADVEIWEVSVSPTGVVTPMTQKAFFHVLGGATSDRMSRYWGGVFTQTIMLPKGTHSLAALQTQGLTSELSPVLTIDAQDPNAPAAPSVQPPPGGYVSGNGKVTVGGRGTPGTAVVVKLGTSELIRKDVDPDGTWTVDLDLGAGGGNFPLTFVAETLVGSIESVTSASAVVKVALPQLSFDTPHEGDPSSKILSITGHGASYSLADNQVYVGDGDGRYFAQRGSLGTAPDGTFSGVPQTPEGDPVVLDYGRHKIKVFQKNGGLDGDGVVHTILVPPPDVIVTSHANDDIVNPVVVISGTGLEPVSLPGTVAVYQGTTKIGEARLIVEGDHGKFDVTASIVGSGSQTLTVKQAASSLSGAGAAESTGVNLTVTVRPPAPMITSPRNGFSQVSTTLDVAGTAVTGYPVTILVDGSPVQVLVDGQVHDTVTAVSPGTFAATLSLSRGSHRLRARQSVPLVDESEGPVSGEILVTVGDVTPPTVWINDTSCPAIESPPSSGCYVGGPDVAAGAGAKCAQLRRLFADALPGEDTHAVAFAGLVKVFDPLSPTSCGPAHVECTPASGSPFPLGSTTVICDAVDCDPVAQPGCKATANHGYGSFVVTVRPPAGTGPLISATGLSVEAQGPSGAAVNYQIAATGYLADCAPLGSGELRPCASWAPAYSGLGFAPNVVGIDPTTGGHGTLFAAFAEPTGAGASPPPQGHVFKSVNGGAWEPVGNIEGNPKFVQLVVARPVGSLDSFLYIPATRTSGTTAGGIRVSRDAGESWTTVLGDQDFYGIATDPANPQHMLAWTSGQTRSTVHETRDGWATSTPLTSEGLPLQQVLSIAVDPADGTHFYASAMPAAADVITTKLYQKQGAGIWLPIDIPPYTSVTQQKLFAPYLAIDPTVAPGQSARTIFAGPVESRDGGKTWLNSFKGQVGAMLFDRNAANVLYFAANDNFLSSTNYGVTFGATNTVNDPVFQSIVQDAQDPQTFYTAYQGLGLFKTTDAGVHWQPELAPGKSLPAVNVKDIAFDPADAGRAFLLAAQDGVFSKSISPTTGSDLWTNVSGNIGNQTASLKLTRVFIDPFNRQNLIVSGQGAYWSSADNGQNWSANATGNDDVLAFDLSAPNSFFSQNSTSSGSTGAWPFRRRQVGVSAFTGFTVKPFPTNFTLTGIQFQLADDARHSIVLSYGSGAATEMRIFSLTDAVSFAITAPETKLTGPVFLNRSAGTPSLFTSGREVAGAPIGLYRYPFDNGVLGTRERVGGMAGNTDFTRLLIDPGTSGQVMYTLGSGNSAATRQDTLWESHDAGHTWQQDTSSPLYLTNIWLSPLDGAVYATVSQDANAPGFITAGNWAGVPWKRQSSTDAPPGARILNGDLRPSCKLGAGALAGRGNRPLVPGAVFAVGPTPIECTATDAFGRTTTQTFTIDVGDHTAPTVTVPASLTFTTATNQTSMVVPTYAPGTSPAPSAVDLVDGTRPVSCNPPEGSTFQVGVTPVTCTATDTHTNVGTAVFSVIIEKGGVPAVGAPQLTVPADQTAEATQANGAVLSLDVHAFAADGVTVIPASCDRDLTTPFELGQTLVTCWAGVDPRQARRSFTITVVDSLPPVFTTFPADIAIDSGPSGTADTSFTVTATDHGASVTPACTKNPLGDTYELGTTPVTCTAVDTKGHRATRTFHVTVRGLPPKLELHDQTKEAEDQLGARSYYDDPPIVARDTAGVTFEPECFPSKGALFPLGDTTVECVASVGGLESRGSFVVHVLDRTGPAVEVPSTITIEATGPGPMPVAFEASAHDAVDGSCGATAPCKDPTCAIVTNAADSILITSPHGFPIGPTAVKCSTADAHGNPGSSTFTVVVTDTKAPCFRLPTDAPAFCRDTFPAVHATADPTDSAVMTTFPLVATDIVSQDVPVACTPPPGSRFVIGTTRVDCTATDGAGNQAQTNFDVVVTSGKGVACTSSHDCNGFACVDGVCCESACGGGDLNDCQACSVATGSTANGVCATLTTAHVCRGKVGACDAADTCDGTHTFCPADQKAANGTSCDDGDACTQDDVCQAGACTAGAPVTCAASDQCHLAGTCNPTTGACSNPAAPNGTACSDDNACTQTDSCQSGTCTGSNPITCTASDQCHVAGTCNPATGLCSKPAAPNGTSCNDGNACTRTDSCQSGTCNGGDPVICTAIDQCHVAGACDTTTGVCSNPVAPNGTICSDGNACTQNDVCQTGHCTAGAPVTCTASDQCHVAGTCNPTTGCSNPAAPNGTTCNDGNACTRTDSCQAGTCTGGNPVTCAASDQCHVAGTCNTSTGTCSNPTAPNGTTCNDGNTCTRSDACQAGVCTGSGSCGTVWTNVPTAPLVAYATSTAGAKVTYPKPTAKNGTTVLTVSCNPPSGNTFVPGKTTVTCTAPGATSPATFTVWVQYQAPTDGSFFLFPIKSDGSSVFCVGRPVPARFKLTGASANITNLVAKLTVTKISNTVPPAINSTSDETVDDTDFVFKYRSLLKWYAYRWKTSNQTQGTYRLEAVLGDGVTHQINVGLRK